jgi:hypothetical protein
MTTRADDEADLLKLFKLRCRPRVDPATWRELIDRVSDDVPVYLSRPKALLGPYDQLLAERRAHASKVKRRHQMPVGAGPDAMRAYALSDLMAIDASGGGDDDQVETFRREVLGRQHLKANEVVRWVERRARSEGRPTVYAEVAVADGGELRRGDQLPARCEVVGSNYRHLAYFNPGEKTLRRIPTRQGGVLDGLRRLGERLAFAYGWQPAQATVFVLTDMVPVVAPVTTTTSIGWFTTRITISTDAAVPPEVVLDEYRTQREEVLTSAARKRVRSMDPSSYELAVFIADRPDETWERTRCRWKEKHRGRKQEGWEKEWRPFKQRAERALSHLVALGYAR